MAPIKFEEDIKDKLEKRTIQPTSQAWSKLASQLEKEESSGRSKGFWWLGIAASVAILIFGGLQFFNNQDQEIIPEIVKNETMKDVQNETIVSQESPSLVIQDNLEESTLIKDNSPKTNNVLTEPKEKYQQSLTVKRLVQETTIKKSTKTETTVTKLDPVEMSFEPQNLGEVIAEIKTLNSTESSGVTDKELDSLLNLAQKEILTNKIIKSSKEVVNAEDLLDGVEYDLQKSFRTRMFESIKSNYKSVKTAVAERNN